MSNELKQAAFASLRLFMRPVARLLLRCGVTWKECAELFKLIYVDVAAEDYGKRGRPANTSRVAILTGLSRREVKRAKDLLKQADGRAFQSIERINHASRVLSGWYQDRDFLDLKGKPRLLSIEGERGFGALLKRYAPDIPSTAMVKELKKVGAVRETTRGRLRAMTRYFMPATLDLDGIVRSGSVLRDFAATVAHNQLRDRGEPTRFEGRATNVRVKRAAKRAFREYVERHGMAFLEDVDRWLSEHEAAGQHDQTDRLGIGVYLITDD
ncbi:MAG TPA: DUF6502 family protein [Gammaproteobacteria bacterium]|nr:DUF6502 family protein [Gammaproteobacteria bacterium]